MTHYSDAAATTPITDVVPGGDVYSVVVFGANVTNLNADDPTARPAIAYTLGADDEVQFDIVAHTAALENGDCRAVLDTDTSRYTCRYSVADSVAATDPGVYSVSVSDATDEGSDTTLAAYNADAGVTIGVRPTVKSVKFYPDLAAAIAATGEITGGVIGDIIYTVILFSENMENINGQTGLAGSNGLPRIRVWTADPASTAPPVGESFIVYTILAHDAELRDNSCRATSATETSEYLCQFDLAGGAREYIRVEVLQESRDLAGHTLADDDSTPNFPLTNPLPPRVDSITHYADVAQTMPISGTVSGGEIYSLVEFTTSAGIDPSDARIFYHLGSAPPVQFRTGEGTPPPGSCHRFEGVGFALNTQYLCRYPVGAADEGQYRVSVGALTVDKVGQALNTVDSVEDSGVTISALRFATGEIDDQNYEVGQSVDLTLPVAAGGAAPFSYTLTRTDEPETLPTELAFDAGARTIKGGPLSAPFGGADGADMIYTVMDANGNSMSIPFTLRVIAVLAFDTSAIPAPASAYTYTAETAITPLTLPPATGGVAPRTYSLTPTASIPDGLIFDVSALTLSGTPTTSSDAVTLTYTVTDANGITAEETFTLEVFSAPTIAADAVSGQVYTVNQPVALTLPESAGAPPLTYTLTRIDGGSPVLPDGLTFDAEARTISDAPEETFGSGAGVSLRYTATDANGAVAFTDFTLLVNAAVTFDISAIPAPDSAYTYPLNTVITALTLPPATGGTGELTYTLTPTMSLPEGLTYAADARTLAGMPTMVTTAAVALTYAATDANDVAATLTFTVAVVDRPVVTITDSIATDTANIADGDVIFTFVFTEDVSEFDVSGISLTGGTAGTLNGTAPGATYTLAVTPEADTNAGTISVTVMENAATGETTSTGNVASTPATQDYDTLVPPVPTIDMVGDDYFINIMERDAGVSLGGGVESGASIDLCIGATDAACTGTTATLAAVTTTWSYALTSGAIDALGDGDTRVQATATDAAGNPGPTASRTFTVDTVAPNAPIINDLAGGNFLNAAERDAGFLVTGTVDEPDLSVSLCILGTLSDPCAALRTDLLAAATTTWSYRVTGTEATELGEGPEALIATATDAAGNPSMLTATDGFKVIIVDTVPPEFFVLGTPPPGTDSRSVAVNTPISVIVYDAVGHDGGFEDEGITYALSGPDADKFEFHDRLGRVKYKAVQTSPTSDSPHVIIITVFDRAGNSATLEVTISVLDAPAVNITSSTPIGDYANGVITFTISFSDAVTGFEPSDVSVAGNTGVVSITPTPVAATTYQTTDSFTLTVTPDTDTNDGTITVTVSVNAVMGAVTMTGNPETSVPQQYDTLAPIITGGDTATAMFIVNDPVTTEVYNADATDGGTAVTGITYSLGGADAGQFNINPATGSVTYINSPSVAADHTIVITATDKGGNTDTITVTITVTITAAFSDNSDLSALTVTTTGGAAVPLSPAFATATSAYTASVRQEVTSVTITLPTAHTGATADITGTAADGTALTVTDSTITGSTATRATISGLTEGISPNTITITVTAADGATMTVYTITLIRAPLLTFGTAANGAAITIADQTYDIGEAIPTLTLPEATGGLGTLSYTLTPTADIPAGLTFAPATRSLSGTPTATESRTLTYTVTDAANPPVTTELTFNVLTRAPLLTFGTAITIADQTYDIGEAIPTLTLPEATGGLGTLSYTLTPTADIPAGLTFAPATRSLSGTPTATETRTLTYTVTDAATPPVTTELTFNVNIVRRTMVKASDTTIALDLDEDGDKTTTDPGNAILTLPSGHSVTEATLNTPPETATNNPPAGVAFSLTTDITLDATLAAAATICLPTTGVPAGREPVLYHYFTRAGQGAATWNEISRDTATREGYICGETLTFSPFAVGYMTGVMGAARLNEQILPRASLVMSASMLAAVAARVEAAADSTGGGGIGAGIGSIDGTGGTSGTGGTGGNSIGTTPTLAYQFGGQSSLHGLFESHGKAMLEGQMEYEQLLEGASFVVPLSTTGDASADNAGDADRRAGAIVFWGNSDYHSLSNNQNGLDWGGPVLSAHLGMDGRINQHLLTGVALSWNRARFDYHDEADGADTTGEYQYRNVSFNPYFGWLPVEGLKLWGTFGYGRGEIHIDEDGSDEYSSDTTQSSLAGGFSHRLFAVTGHPGIGLLSGGVITLNVKGDATLARVGVESSEEDIAAQDVDSQRLRLLLAGEVRYGLANGGALRPSLEIGMRYDGGDGETGSGLEVGSGLRYTNPIETLAVAGNVRTSLAQGYAEWGGGFTVQLSPRAGRGLSLSLHPVWGRTQSTAERLWRDGVDEVGNATGDTALQRSVDTEIGYGVAASALGKAGVLTPYTGINVTEGTRRLRMGGRFAGDDGLRLSLEGAQENTVDGASHTVLLRGGVEF